MNSLLREMARIAEEEGLCDLARTLEQDAPRTIRDRRSKGWAESRYRMPKKGV